MLDNLFQLIAAENGMITTTEENRAKSFLVTFTEKNRAANVKYIMYNEIVKDKKALGFVYHELKLFNYKE